MNAEATTTKPTPAEIVAAELANFRNALKTAVDAHTAATDNLWKAIVDIRPKGILTVDEMAEAVERDRNYVDSVWSAHGTVRKGKQTRVPVADHDGVAEEARAAYDELKRLAGDLSEAAELVTTVRANRDTAVVSTYASRVLGPSAIARHVGVDRNHVLRIARKAGIRPVHRTDSRNQYSAK